MNNDIENKSGLTIEESDSLKGVKKGILGGYPIGTKEFYVLTYFLWVISFFTFFITVRMFFVLLGI